MKNKFTFYHLLLINHVVMTLIVLGIIGAYGTYLVNIEQKAARERLDPLMVREAGRIKSDFQSIESNVQKLKSFVEMFEYIPANLRVERFKRFASEALAPYPIQYNAFVALGPRLSRKYFNRNAYVLTIHRNAALEGSEKYLSPDTFIAEEFLSPGYDKDPDVEWWAMNKNRPGLNFSNFYFDKGYMEKVMFTSAMGLYGHDEVEAVVGVDTLTGEMAQRMGAFHLGETGGLFVVDESGRPVWSLVSKDLPLIGFRYEKPATIDQFKKMSSLSGKVFNFTQEHIQDFTGEDGDTYITFSKPVQIKGRSWHLVAYQKKSEAFGALYGRIFFFLISVFVAYLAGSIMLYLTGRYVIRREKRAFEELRKSRDVAEAATKAKSVFLSTMSHEIRTPLNSLLGSADLLMETKLNQEQHEYVNSMMNAGESLLSVVNNVLDFSKIEAGKMSLDLKEFSLSEFIRQIESLVRPSICRKGLQFQIHYPSMDAVLIGDALRLKQVILNLLGNAVKFTDRGGIELSIRLEEISSDPGIRRVRFEVKDTGVGIAQENLEKIFDKFRQEDSSVTRRFGGSGLGLSISKEIIEMMHGQLFYHSSQSVGSTFGFYVDLPLISQAPWISQTTYQTPSIMSGLTFDEDGTTAPRIRRVLLVDDMDENHVLLRAYMKSIPNLEVDSAYTGMECLEKCQENHYDLIFMDIQMPNMSGLETIRLLREGEKQNQMPRVPVIVVSANSFIEDREKSLAVGADEHCGKPVRKQMIMELIEKYCSKKAENLNVN